MASASRGVARLCSPVAVRVSVHALSAPTHRSASLLSSRAATTPVHTPFTGCAIVSGARCVSTLAKLSAVGAGLMLRVFYRELSPEHKRLLWQPRFWWETFKQSHRLVKLLVLSGCLAGGVLYAAYDVTPTGRRRFIWTSRRAVRDLAFDLDTALCDLYEEHLMPPSAPLHKWVSAALERLVDAVDRHPELGARRRALGLTFDLKIIDDPDQEEPKMFVLPNGTVYMFSTFTDTVACPEAFACMMAHELIHCLLQHRAEEMSWKGVVRGLGTLAYTLGFATGPTLTLAGAMSVASERAATDLLPPAYRRDLEMEADLMGLELAAVACVDVRAAPREWQRLAILFPEEREGVERFTLLTDSHPPHEARVAALQAALPAALKMRDSCGCKPLPEEPDSPPLAGVAGSDQRPANA